MKRYTVLDTSTFEEFSSLITEDIEGAWVKFEDVEGIEKIRFFRVNCALCSADLSKGNHLASCDLSRCNCEETIHRKLSPEGLNDLCKNWWICPAHGYKKL